MGESEKEMVLDFFREISGRSKGKRAKARKEDMEKLKKAVQERGVLTIADAAAVLHCSYSKASQILPVLASENPDDFLYQRGILVLKKKKEGSG